MKTPKLSELKVKESPWAQSPVLLGILVTLHPFLLPGTLVMKTGQRRTVNLVLISLIR